MNRMLLFLSLIVIISGCGKGIDKPNTTMTSTISPTLIPSPIQTTSSISSNPPSASSIITTIPEIAVKQTSTIAPEQTDAGITVDKGIFNVEVTIPASLFDGQNTDDVITKAKAEGVNEVVKNKDGSFTYKMSKSEYQKMLDETLKSITDYIGELKTNGDYKSIKDVTYNKSLTEFDVKVDKDSFEGSFDAFAGIGLGFTSMLYQALNNVPSDKLKTTVNFEDAVTGDSLDTAVYPDALTTGSD